MARVQLEISDKEFKKLAKLIYDEAGIRLKSNKKLLLRSRLRSRLKELDFQDFTRYYDYVCENRDEEMFHLLQAISTNVTSFFRESKHFDFMREQIIPDLVEKYNKSPDNTYIHLWSAACSTGQEPYSMAITLLEEIQNIRHFDLKILATDISRKVLEIAKKGVYREKDVKNMERFQIDRFFDMKIVDGEKKFVIKNNVKQLVRYGLLNLNKKGFPFSKQFDVIFCRNVMIYFDEPVVQNLIDRFYRNLKKGGYLIIGHSESLASVDHDFTYVKPTIYQK